METAADVDVPNYVEGDWCEVLRCKRSEADFGVISSRLPSRAILRTQLIRLASTDHKVVGSAAEHWKDRSSGQSAEPHLIKLIEHDKRTYGGGDLCARSHRARSDRRLLLVNRLQGQSGEALHSLRCRWGDRCSWTGAEHAVPGLISCLSRGEGIRRLRHELVREITHATGKIGPKATAACESHPYYWSTPIRRFRGRNCGFRQHWLSNPAAILTMAEAALRPLATHSICECYGRPDNSARKRGRSPGNLS